MAGAQGNHSTGAVNRQSADRRWPAGHHRAVRIADFALERYFARWEFAVEHVACASDVEGWSMAELLALADDETRAMWAASGSATRNRPGHPLLRREIAALYDSRRRRTTSWSSPAPRRRSSAS